MLKKKFKKKKSVTQHQENSIHFCPDRKIKCHYFLLFNQKSIRKAGDGKGSEYESVCLLCNHSETA